MNFAKDISLIIKLKRAIRDKKEAQVLRGRNCEYGQRFLEAED